MTRRFSVPLLVSTLSAFPAVADDQSDIIALLEREAATWRAGDVEGHADCWVFRPYTRVLVSTAAGKMIDVDPAFIISPAPDSMGNGGYAELSDFRFSIQDDAAWVSHHEVSVSASGDKAYSNEIRMLEKVDGDWKLVGQSIHAYQPASQ